MVSEPVSATPASVLRTLANPFHHFVVSEPVSATPASVLRTLANPFHHFVVYLNPPQLVKDFRTQ